VFEDLRKDGIGVNVHYIPVHLNPYYQAMGFSVGDFPTSERYYSEAISLPLFPTMSDADQDQVIRSLSEALKQ
jgi:dTDP-4-amino-4,6-dideoxygalactose transaminase